LTDTDMVFITAGMGGGTGTGAAPIIAEIARERGILTVAVVTKPFNFEGNRRMRQAEAGIAEMRKHVDTLIIIPNQKLIANVGKNTPMLDAFRKADDVLLQAVRGIAELITQTGYINVDFADVNAVMRETRGMAMMGSGVGSGENRACEAAERAISSPLLEDVDIHGARGILVNVTGSEDMTLAEYDEAVSIIYNMADEDANIICGMVYDQGAGEDMRVTVVATGLSCETAPELASIKTPVQETLHLPPAGRMQHMSAAVAVKPMETAVPVVTEHSDVITAPGFGAEQAYDEAMLQVPTWIRRQAD
jgi:cell division protein FtsZ